MQQATRIPSKRMPKFVPERTGVVGWIILGAFGAGLIYLCWSHPIVLAVVLIIAGVSCAFTVADRRRQRRIATERHGESICSFARSFDCRATDTWIVRAVFEELATYVQFPIRPEDRLQADLNIDSEDIDDIAEVAQRTGRRLEHCEANPLYGKVETVGELVEFFVHQSRKENRDSLRYRTPLPPSSRTGHFRYPYRLLTMNRRCPARRRLFCALHY